MRHTRQRAEILRAIEGTDRHPSAEWVLDEVRKALPKVSLATVYRQLAALAAEGRVVVLSSEDGPRRYDAHREAHHHVVCTGCGGIADVPDLIGATARTEIERWTGYSVTGLRLDWVGLCPACAHTPEAPAQNPPGQCAV